MAPWMYPTNLGLLGVIGVRMLETIDGEITLETETQWEGNCSCILSVGLPMGISLPAEVGSLPTFAQMWFPLLELVKKITQTRRLAEREKER